MRKYGAIDVSNKLTVFFNLDWTLCWFSTCFVFCLFVIKCCFFRFTRVIWKWHRRQDYNPVMPTANRTLLRIRQESTCSTPWTTRQIRRRLSQRNYSSWRRWHTQQYCSFRRVRSKKKWIECDRQLWNYYNTKWPA